MRAQEQAWALLLKLSAPRPTIAAANARRLTRTDQL
jgi:hypothetical protein